MGRRKYEPVPAENWLHQAWHVRDGLIYLGEDLITTYEQARKLAREIELDARQKHGYTIVGLLEALEKIAEENMKELERRRKEAQEAAEE